jgi:hypothetical protein
MNDLETYAAVVIGGGKDGKTLAILCRPNSRQRVSRVAAFSLGFSLDT